MGSGFAANARRETGLRTLAQISAAAILVAAAVAATADTPRVGIATLKGAVDPAMASYLERAVKEAEDRGYDCLVITMDTPGGLMASMNAITQALLNSKVPTVTYVYPRGAESKSAGIFIMYAADIAAMSPATSMGSAHPVFLPMGGEPGQEGEEGKGAAGQIETMLKKVEHSAVAQIRAMADRRGRNADWAEEAVRQSVSVTETVALEKNIINLIADGMDDLLAKLDGMTVDTGGEHALHTTGAVTIDIPLSMRERVLHGLANPNIAYILMLIAIYGIIFELSNPGAILPGIAGAVALIMALYSFAVLSVNVAGLLLIALAVLLFLADIKTPGHGILTVGGIFSFAFGSFLLFRTPESFMHVSISLVVAMTVVTAAFFVFIVGAGLLAQRRRVQTGAESVPGKRGEARSKIDAEGGMAFVAGQLWTARSVADEIPKGAHVEVVGFDGMVALVRGLDSEGAGKPHTPSEQ
jgi:membrane-bound serine protease (ClpP class)